MEIEYFFESKATGSLNVEDVGNCAIEAFTDDGKKFYFISKTKYGFTRILTYGPIDMARVTRMTTINYKLVQIEYRQSKLKAKISEFLLNPFYKITQAICIPSDNFRSEFISPLKIFDFEMEEE